MVKHNFGKYFTKFSDRIIRIFVQIYFIYFEFKLKKHFFNYCKK